MTAMTQLSPNRSPTTVEDGGNWKRLEDNVTFEIGEKNHNIPYVDTTVGIYYPTAFGMNQITSELHSTVKKTDVIKGEHLQFGKIDGSYILKNPIIICINGREFMNSHLSQLFHYPNIEITYSDSGSRSSRMNMREGYYVGVKSLYGTTTERLGAYPAIKRELPVDNISKFCTERTHSIENFCISKPLNLSADGYWVITHGFFGLGITDTQIKASLAKLSKGIVFQTGVNESSYVKKQPAGEPSTIQRTAEEKQATIPTSAGETSRDGRFIANDNGTVLDTRTNLIWAAKDNGGEIKWHDAKSYCENYRGGGHTDWRMPTQDELASLYDKSKSYKLASGHNVNLTELIRLSAGALWASETKAIKERPAAAYFTFVIGQPSWVVLSSAYRGVRVGVRVLPVRSAK